MTTVSDSEEDGETESTETSGRVNFDTQDGLMTADQPSINPTTATHSQRSYNRVDLAGQMVESGGQTSSHTTKGGKGRGKKHADD